MNHRRLVPIVLVFGLWLGQPRVVAADDPPEAPAKQKVFSSNRKFFVVTDPAQKATVAYEIRGGRTRRLWTLPEYVAVPLLSDDGRYLAIVYPGGNLIAQDHRPDEVMLSFYDRGRLIKRLRLNELIPDEKRLVPTASHKLWAESLGFERGHHFRVETVDHEVQTFDVSTGERVVRAAPR